ncbi:tail fiber assembly protein [Providencia sp. PROV226]|uniref:tail fiber assembly protein n=1 Tax=Providencia sp. PROV226 TaxID=2949919 RepID=UPI0023497C58|nr:tail fiber assembly protein [Providencia sp. PROV226]
MIYFKDNKNNVLAYAKTDLKQVDRATELEQLLAEKEPVFLEAKKNVDDAATALNEAREKLILASANIETSGDDAEISIEDDESDEEIQRILLLVDTETNKYNEALVIFTPIELEYLQLKSEYAEILPVFFDIRENLKSLRKMTAKEVDAHLNPPIPKEQLIAEAEQKKQSLLSEASTAIAPLQYAENLGIATAEESASLVDWQKYSVYLNRIDTSLAPDIDWPVKPE